MNEQESARLTNEKLAKANNILARSRADALDALATVKQQMVELAEEATRERAAVELSSGRSVYEVASEMYESGNEVVQVIVEQAYDAGYLEGLREAQNLLHIHEIKTARRNAGEKL